MANSTPNIPFVKGHQVYYNVKYINLGCKFCGYSLTSEDYTSIPAHVSCVTNITPVRMGDLNQFATGASLESRPKKKRRFATYCRRCDRMVCICAE